jgi:transcriptional regulator with XRE-family HTH domain
MPNDRLRTAMLERGVTPTDLATALQVDPKTIERWISGRTPYRRHRYAVAAHLGVDETYLWPDALGSDQIASASESEIVNVYPHRWTVPSDLWRNFFDNADEDRRPRLQWSVLGRGCGSATGVPAQGRGGRQRAYPAR